jgi:hypothetical protein
VVSRSSALTIAAQARIGALLTALGEVDAHIDFDTLGLDALFVDDGPLRSLARIAEAERVVSWYGAGDAVFRRRLAAIAPRAVVESSAGVQDDVWRHLVRTVDGARAEDDACSVGHMSFEGGTRASDLDPVSIPATLRVDGRRALLDLGWDGATPLIVVHPGAGGAPKRWPAEGFAAVVAAITARARSTIVIHRGPADTEAAGALSARLPAALQVDDPSLPLLAGMLSHASIFLGNDSGVSHLAAAVAAPSVVLFTTTFARWRPWSGAARTVFVSTSVITDADVAAVTDAAIAVSRVELQP